MLYIYSECANDMLRCYSTEYVETEEWAGAGLRDKKSLSWVQ